MRTALFVGVALFAIVIQVNSAPSDDGLVSKRVLVKGEGLYLEYSYYNGNDSSTFMGNRPGAATSTHSCNRITSVPSHLREGTHMYPSGLGQFYQKYTEAYGIPVLGSYYLSDSALQRACYTVRFLFADRYANRNSYYKKGGRFALMGVNEVTTDIPEHTYLGPWWNERARGLGATVSAPVATGGEENALCLDNDRYRIEDILLHEFSHGLHLLGFYFAMPGVDARITQLYNHAKSTGLWYNTYAMSTAHELWAEAVQYYFEVNGYANPANGIHGPIKTREDLRRYDPNIYALVEEVFPCRNTYIKRCRKDRNAEMNQKLKIDFDKGGCRTEGGGGDVTTPKPDPTTPDVNATTPEPTTPKPGCEDDYDPVRCKDLASRGGCEHDVEWMHKMCQKSCKLCEDEKDCVDENKSCAHWAAYGECKKNPDYMLVSCKKSCKVC